MTHGAPCWYELSTNPGALPAAEAFYTSVIGWTFRDSGMTGFEYHLASADDDMVAGAMVMPADVAGMPPMWMIYFAVDDCDGAARLIGETGGKVFREPADIPGTGRFAIAGDPAGAGFGLLQPLPMTDGQSGGNAFDQKKAAHGHWNELMSTDPEKAFEFYSRLLGWTKSTAMDMGEMGTYQLFAHGGVDIGGMMRLGNAPVPGWLPYFGVEGVESAVARIKSAGGALLHGPMQVPGGNYIAVARDPQGASFAVTGPLN